MNGAIGVLSKTFVVSHHADRRAAGVQFFQQVHHRFAVARIEITGRLIGEKNCRFAGQGPRHRDALLLTAGKLAGQMFRRDVPCRRARALR